MNTAIKQASFADDFIRGQRDCLNGHPARANESDAYNRGYAAQYELEQVQTHWSENNARSN